MKEQIITIIGLLAGTLTTLAFVPQVLHTWKSKSTKDVSLKTFLMFCSGILLWLIYGLFKQDMAIILANSITFILASIILGLKLKYK
ncbi:SemiSWEET transporter [Laspinema olomoucense]|uniref:SemiSWEET transporter n=1 Tax=Laspinema olomoucense D3b TaxID=2953688 RepID=A0ABT2N6P2_9CYAN|nr:MULTISPECIES: SemiSWEET transporter [unclassified Laspinema]MCT7972234.1 SemiSWEET transporter [Laspinema sp. D3d]MCT7978367.1 SemiSWEET transporter [Laspinema sp. D3b]MCT7990529.1 SemiSWEET transporter [Laspinema sp. D3a]MCT7993050.1 SemiSWEET transporter [Laspinema sp. D3c]